MAVKKSRRAKTSMKGVKKSSVAHVSKADAGLRVHSGKFKKHALQGGGRRVQRTR